MSGTMPMFCCTSGRIAKGAAQDLVPVPEIRFRVADVCCTVATVHVATDTFTYSIEYLLGSSRCFSTTTCC